MQQPNSGAESPDSTQAPSRDLALDWATLWQSELAAIAADPETLLVLQSLAGAWLQAAAVLDAAVYTIPGADAPPRAAPARSVTGARDAAADDIAGLRHRLAELERRLAGDAAGTGSAGFGG